MVTLTALLISIFLIQTADCTCAFLNTTGGQSGGGSTFHISEANDTIGTVVLNGTKDANDSVGLDLKSGRASALGAELQASFQLIQTATSFTILTTKVIDLEYIWHKFGIDVSKIVVRITCTNNTLSPVIAVDPVDEFPPTFNKSQYTINVPENTNVGSTVFRLSEIVHDDDVPLSIGDLVYTVQEYTGISYFASDPNTGDITLMNSLDYDAPGALRRFVVTVKVAEFSGRHLVGTSMLTVSVTNVEDVPPYFIYPNCPPPCMAPLYDSLTTITQTGPLQLRPTNLIGGDDEGFGTQLTYAISQGNGRMMFAINPSTGGIRQTKSVATAKAPESEFRLIVQVRKNNSTVLSAIAVLVIRVKERLGNATTIGSCLPSPLSAPPVAGPDLLIPMAIVGVIAALSFGGFIFMIVVYRRKQTDSHVRPIQVKPGMPNGGIQAHGIGGPEYNNKAFINALPIFNTKQPLSTLK